MPSSVPTQPSAERRSLTVMFCDLVGSTALSARLDPEDLRDVLAAYQRRATEILEAAGGRVARYEGDGVLAYFGFPSASEDDAERAVEAGLELAHRIGTEGAGGQALSVRVGIATGIVVVGELLRSQVADNPPVVGETPNLAARMQALAEPGAVVIAESTHRLTGGLFEYRDLGMQRLNGFAGEVRAWHVVGPGVSSRFSALRSRELPLLGREAETATLLDRWALAEKGIGCVIVVSGEAGIGKSRLVSELMERAAARGGTVLRFQCSPHHESSMLHPLLERLQRPPPVDRPDLPSDRLERLKVLLRARDQAADAALALLTDLMAVPAGTRAHAEPDARQKRDALLEGLLGTLQRRAEDRPLLLVLEDAHWIDPTSLQLLDLIVARMRSWPLLLVVTCRPELKPAWSSQPHVTGIDLAPIAAADAEAMVKCVPGGANLAQAVAREIAARADGVPLFIEELTKAVVEAHGSAPTPRTGHPALAAIPATLHASLMARLDRIGAARQLAKLAAALGREFSFELMSAVVAERDPDAIRRELQQLIDADLIVPSTQAPEAYMFRHALIQDAAYGTLLRSERRLLHGRIARAIEERFPEIVATRPEIVAAHCTRAELWEPAIRYWLGAGRRAMRGWALVEASKHLSEGMRIAGLMPQSPVRQRLELELYTALAPVTMWASGYASQEALELHRRMEPLVAAMGSAFDRLMALQGLFDVHYGRAELTDALAVAREYCALSEQHGYHLGRAYSLLAQTYAAMGAFADADREFERSLAAFAENPEEPSAQDAFGSRHVISLALHGSVLYALGRPEEGRASIAASIKLALSLDHAMLLALTLVTDLLTPIPGGLDPDPARADEVVQFCAQRGLRNFQIWAELARGAMVARRGDARAGIAAMRAAIDAAEATSSRLFRPIQLGTLAAAHAKLGETDTALTLVDEALATSARTGERSADPALYRLRGELLLAAGERHKGMHELQHALTVARAQGAKAEEGRIESAIARLQQAPARKGRFGPLAILRALFAR